MPISVFNTFCSPKFGVSPNIFDMSTPMGVRAKCRWIPLLMEGQQKIQCGGYMRLYNYLEEVLTAGRWSS